MTAPFVRSPYNYDLFEASEESALRCEDPSLADQSFEEECNINTIVRNFGVTGELPQDLPVPRSGDFTDALDYQQSLNLIIEANRAFMAMPAEVRARFGNNAEEFVAFASDSRNLDECRKLGLADPVQAPRPPVEVRVVADPTQVLQAVRGAVEASQPPSQTAAPQA